MGNQVSCSQVLSGSVAVVSWFKDTVTDFKKTKARSFFSREKKTKTCQTWFWGGRNKTTVRLFIVFLPWIRFWLLLNGVSEAFLDKMFCSAFKVLDVKMWLWHEAKCLLEQLFDVGCMAVAVAAAHKSRSILIQGAAARPSASIKKVENIFAVNVSHVDWQRFSGERFITPLCGWSDFTVKTQSFVSQDFKCVGSALKSCTLSLSCCHWRNFISMVWAAMWLDWSWPWCWSVFG